MKIMVGFRGEVKSILSCTDGENIEYAGSGSRSVQRIVSYYSNSASSTDLLRLLLKKLKGHWWAKEISEGTGNVDDSSNEQTDISTE